MAYVDDWYHTPLEDQKRLQEKCLRPFCGHMHYLHGDTRETSNPRAISYTPGKCSRCKCAEFQDVTSITKDEILDIEDWFKTTGEVRLADFGITAAECAQPITRFYENGTLELKCKRLAGHEGAHDADA